MVVQESSNEIISTVSAGLSGPEGGLLIFAARQLSE